MNSYTGFLYFILFVKSCFALTLMIDLLDFVFSDLFSDEFVKKSDERKERLENLYFFLMGLMLIMIFRERSKLSIKFMKFELELLYLFGLVLSFKLFFTWLKRFRAMNKTEKKDDNIVQESIDVTTDIFVPLLY